MLQECDKGLRAPVIEQPGDGKAEARNWGVWRQHGKEKQKAVSIRVPPKWLGIIILLDKSILLLRKNVSLMINYVFQNIIKIQYLFFLDFQDYHLDTYYHKHLIYAGERIIALGIPGIF